MGIIATRVTVRPEGWPPQLKGFQEFPLATLRVRGLCRRASDRESGLGGHQRPAGLIRARGMMGGCMGQGSDGWRWLIRDPRAPGLDLESLPP
jgi:hypothetical protein